MPRPLSDYERAAGELGALGIDGAHHSPDPLQVKHIRPRRFGALTFEELVFDHEPTLPASVLADGHGGWLPAACGCIAAAIMGVPG